MASNDWTDPTIDGTHIDILAELKGRDVDSIKMIDDETPTNLPAKAKKWDDALKVFRSWIDAAWVTLILGVSGGGTGSATAAGARTNLGVDSSAEVDGKVATHQAITNPHSSTAVATPSRLVLRDAAGRTQMVAPSAAADVAIKSTVDTVQTNLTTHADLANPHGAVSAPTANKLILRDAAGRAQVEDPSAAKDIVNKQYLEDNIGTSLTNFESYKKEFGGDGSDGDVTISENTTLGASGIGVKVMQYNNLTVNVGVYLEAHANDKVLVILVKGTLTLNGTIRMNGRGGVGGTTYLIPGGAGAFGGGGGGAGRSYGPTGGGGGGQPGQPGTYVEVGVPGRGGGENVSDYLWSPSLPITIYGKGGAGGSGAERMGTNILGTSPLTPLQFEIARYLYGGGGGCGTSDDANGKDGGAGGGVVWIEAESIVWGGSGLISCNGVDGTAGGGGYYGGGGGGAGGFVQAVYKEKTGSSTITVTGGVGGIGSGGSSTGGDGATGTKGEFLTE